MGQRSLSEIPKSTTQPSIGKSSASTAASQQWGGYNPFRAAAEADAPTSRERDTQLSSATAPVLPPIVPLPGMTRTQSAQAGGALSPTAARRRTADPRELANAQIRSRRSVSPSVGSQEADATATPPLLAAPSSELDWSDDNPFSFLKTPAPQAPGGTFGDAFSGPIDTLSHSDLPIIPRIVPPQSANHEESARRRPRSHSSTMKSRLQVLAPPPPLVAPDLPPDIALSTPDDHRKLQIIQAYFKGRIERAKVKHMIEKQVMGRRFTMEEILLSERRYVHHLDLIITHFLKPLQKTDVLTQIEISAIFLNVEHLYQLARNFLRQLEDLFKEDALVIGHRVGLLFLNTIPEWRVYSFFVNHFDGATIQVSRCKERKSFREWLAKVETHPALEKLGMMDYMITGCKRIPQYELLLKAVKKNTPKSSRHYQTIKTAKNMVTELAGYLNDKKKQFDNMRKIAVIQRSLHGKIPNLQTPGRELLAEAVIKEEDTLTHQLIDRHIFLFNDSLLSATSSNNKFDRMIYLSGGEINPKSPLKLVLRIEEVSFIAIFQNEQEKAKWVALIAHAIETLAFQEQESVLKEFAPSGYSRPKVVNSVILHQGYLLKHRRSSGGWNKRWFVLEQGILYYFKNPSKLQDITQRGTIDLGHYSIRTPIDWTSGTKRRYGFELTSNTRPIFVLAAENPQDRNDWAEALKPFLMSAKATDREGVLMAASTSVDVARTASSSRVLLPTYRQSAKGPVDDLIHWSDEPSSHPPPPSSGSFYFNEDTMSRSVSSIPEEPEENDWFSQTTALPPLSPTKMNPLRRSISSSSIADRGNPEM